MNSIALYFKMIGSSIRSQLQYRASFVMFTIGNALSALIEYLGVWALFGRFGSLSGWTLAEAGVFFGLGNIGFALCEMFSRGFDTFQRQVREGTFDRILLRPRTTVLQMLGVEFQVMRIGRLLQGIAVLAISLPSIGVAWGLSHWTLAILTIFGGMFMFSAIIVLQATSCFWTVESLEVWNSITYGGITTIQYPLDVYQRPLRIFFTFIVPMAAVNYWPCSYLLGRNYAPALLSWASPFIGLVCFLLSLLVWRFGVRHYRSTGS